MSLQEQYQQILHAVFTQKALLSEYAAEQGLTQEQAEQLMADALRWKKKDSRASNTINVLAEGTHHLSRQGARFPGLAVDISVEVVPESSE